MASLKRNPFAYLCVLSAFAVSCCCSFTGIGFRLKADIAHHKVAPDGMAAIAACASGGYTGDLRCVLGQPRVESSRNLAMSLVGALPKKRLYSLLNCEAL